ncbi:discoidin domain-containing protein [uncultured Cohaesibacter sp.]|uniref:discoidin domain-containing protein n=1 Tax=uncultured Cohaesibacter sp. TaxID=1002546 RepID=UPI002AA8D9CE|nr:discoidin domain-containing protein [uncultured Cohaesibacter sp.]
MRVTICNKDAVHLCSAEGQDELWLIHEAEYEPGDTIEILDDKTDAFLVVQLDDAMSPALCFLKDGKASFQIPFDEMASIYSPRSFHGKSHYVHVRRAYKREIANYRDMALNPYDQKQNKALFPHAFANVETRNEYGFAARNAIDGFKSNDNHGVWPYTSWGINQDPQAQLTVDFGREIDADKVVIYLRADFPHDAWWTSAKLDFSDGTQLDVSFEKTGKAQCFCFKTKRIRNVSLHSLIKADTPSPFPALTAIEVWGTEASLGDKTLPET